jgi:hypothetical protein
LHRWAQIAASYVKQVVLNIAEFHTFSMVIDDDADTLQYRYPYIEQKAISLDVHGSYARQRAETKVTKNTLEP